MPARLEPTHSKTSVDYSKGMSTAYCGICAFYVPGNYTTDGRCEKVRGRIDSAYWCKLFEKD